MKKALLQTLTCLKCNHAFSSDGPSDCEECGHPYLKWTNFDRFKTELPEEQGPKN